jgi:hypothetical protein
LSFPRTLPFRSSRSRSGWGRLAAIINVNINDSLYQYQYFRLGSCTCMSCSMQELYWASCCAHVAGRLWGVDHCWILDRQLHVLHTDGTNITSWLLV